MKNRFFLLAMLVSTALTVSAQERKIALWGHVFDQVTHHAIRDAKATLMLGDSTIVDSVKCGYYTGGYYGTDANYRFSIPRKPAVYIIKVEHPDYEPCFVNYEVKTPGRNTFFDAPWHYMVRRSRPVSGDTIAATKALDEVVVKATRIKMVYKNDTIVYDASAFQLPEGSMLDALVRQMPGVELKDDGTIFVNGEKVDYLTLNGKDFFKGRNKVMLENLPLYAVEKVKVYRKSTEKSEWLGREVEKKDFVMDVHLKREYKEGYMANAEAAGGTEDRYVGRLFGLRFTEASRMSAFVNANNVNETRHPGQNGEWTPDKALGNGMNEHIKSGFDINIDDKKKRWDELLTLNFDHSKKHWDATELNEVFASGGSQFGNLHEWGGNKIVSGDVNNRFRWKNMFSPFKLNLEQWVIWGRATSDNHGETTQWQEADTLNRTRYNTTSRQSGTWRMGMTNTLNYRMPWGDDLEVEFTATYIRENGGDEQTGTLYDYPLQHRSVFVGRTIESRPSHRYNLHGHATYTIHALNNWNYVVYASAGHHTDVHHQDHFLMPDTTTTAQPSFLIPDPDNTEHYTTRSRNATLTLETYYTKQEGGRYTWFDLKLNASTIQDRIDFHHARLDTVATHTDHVLTYYASFVHNTKHRGYELGLFSSINRLNIRNFIPIHSTTNPLLILLNNPNIKPQHAHVMSWRLRFIVPERQQNLTLNGNSTISLQPTGTRRAYDSKTGAYTLMYDYVNRPTWSINQEAHFSRPLDAKKLLTLEAHARLNYKKSHDFDVIQYAAMPSQPLANLLASCPLSATHNLYNSEGIHLTYHSNRLELSAVGNFAYHHSTSQRTSLPLGEGKKERLTLNIFEYNYGLTLNCRLPWQLQLAADIKIFSRRGYQSESMNTNDLVCNASLSRTFLKKSLTLTFEAFDLFHQLRSTDYSLNAQTRTETWRKSIPAYLMLHLSWRWSHLP